MRVECCTSNNVRNFFDAKGGSFRGKSGYHLASSGGINFDRCPDNGKEIARPIRSARKWSLCREQTHLPSFVNIGGCLLADESVRDTQVQADSAGLDLSQEFASVGSPTRRPRSKFSSFPFPFFDLPGLLGLVEIA